MSALDAKAFRQALGQFATGVTIITTRSPEGEPVGLTANSFSSVSLDPPLVLWSLDQKARSLPVFEQQPYFAIHVLASDQIELSNRFASKQENKFAGLELEAGPGQIPLLQHCAARFVCEKTYEYEGGDHRIFVGRVLDFSRRDEPPLLFHGGQYAEKRPHAQHCQPLPGSDVLTDDFLMYLLERLNAQIVQPFHLATRDSGVSVCGMHILALLSAASPRSVEDLRNLIPEEAAELLEALTELNQNALVTVSGEDHVSLTTGGRDQIMQILAAGKAFEADALQDLDAYEQSLFKDMLKRVIRRTDTGIPDPFA